MMRKRKEKGGERVRGSWEKGQEGKGSVKERGKVQRIMSKMKRIGREKGQGIVGKGPGRKRVRGPWGKGQLKGREKVKRS